MNTIKKMFGWIFNNELNAGISLALFLIGLHAIGLLFFWLVE